MLVDSNNQPLQPKKEKHTFILSIPEDEFAIFALACTTGVLSLRGSTQMIPKTLDQLQAHLNTLQTLLESKL